MALNLPKHVTVLEPRVRKDAIQPPENIRQMSHARLRPAMRRRSQRKTTGEVFRGGEDVSRPVEGVAAVVDSAAGLGRVVDGAEILPLRSAHFRTGLRGTGRFFGKEGDYQIVDFHSQKAAELIEPEGPVNSFRRLGELGSNTPVDRDGRI